MTAQIPEDSALFRLLTAAHKLAEASAEVIALAHAPKDFARNVDLARAGFPGDNIHPCDDALDLICNAIVELHRAAGDLDDTLPIAEAAAARLIGADLP